MLPLMYEYFIDRRRQALLSFDRIHFDRREFQSLPVYDTLALGIQAPTRLALNRFLRRVYGK